MQLWVGPRSCIVMLQCQEPRVQTSLLAPLESSHKISELLRLDLFPPGSKFCKEGGLVFSQGEMCSWTHRVSRLGWQYCKPRPQRNPKASQPSNASAQIVWKLYRPLWWPGKNGRIAIHLHGASGSPSWVWELSEGLPKTHDIAFGCHEVRKTKESTRSFVLGGQGGEGKAGHLKIQKVEAISCF